MAGGSRDRPRAREAREDLPPEARRAEGALPQGFHIPLEGGAKRGRREPGEPPRQVDGQHRGPESMPTLTFQIEGSTPEAYLKKIEDMYSMFAHVKISARARRGQNARINIWAEMETDLDIKWELENTPPASRAIFLKEGSGLQKTIAHRIKVLKEIGLAARDAAACPACDVASGVVFDIPKEANDLCGLHPQMLWHAVCKYREFWDACHDLLKVLRELLQRSTTERILAIYFCKKGRHRSVAARWEDFNQSSDEEEAVPALEADALRALPDLDAPGAAAGSASAASGSASAAACPASAPTSAEIRPSANKRPRTKQPIVETPDYLSLRPPAGRERYARCSSARWG